MLFWLQDEYVTENIQVPTVPFYDNQPRLDLLAKPPHGLIHILSDATSFPKVGYFYCMNNICKAILSPERIIDVHLLLQSPIFYAFCDAYM